MNNVLLRMFLVGCTLVASVFSREIATPSPVQVQITGKTGTKTICYRIFAESADSAKTYSRYLADFPGQVTNLSATTVVQNAPDKVNAKNKIILTIAPVEGAVKYHIVKTEILEAPTLSIKAKKPGNGTLYYWVQGHNGWNNSACAGPFAIKCNPDDFENDVTITPASPQQFKHSVWVTKTTELPVGRKLHLVYNLYPHTQGGLLKYPFTFAHTSKNYATWGPGPFETTDPAKAPYGTGKFLLASTNSLSVVDSGQELKLIQVPNVNETIDQSLEDRIEKEQSVRGFTQGLQLKADYKGHTSMEPDYYGTYYPFSLDVVADRGGVYAYQNPTGPGSEPGYKSWIGAMKTDVTSRTVGQHVAEQTWMSNYGVGDYVVHDAALALYAGNREGGDEGGSIFRTTNGRYLSQSNITLTHDAKKGSRYLDYKGSIEKTGAGRIIVNLTQSFSKGRIDHVANCDIFGEGTNWSAAYEGWFISVDIDNVASNGGKEIKRSWFEISEVISPTHIRVIMHTNWRRDMNLGYSRFIFNPAKGQTQPSLKDAGLTYGGPEVLVPSKNEFDKIEKTDPELVKEKRLLYTNPAAIGVLPKNLEVAATQGKFLMAPGTYLDDPYLENGKLHVEGVVTDWKKGDELCLTIGTCQTMSICWGLMGGELGPNDWASGYCVKSWFDNRPLNGIAFQSDNVGIGMQITLPKDKQGNGVIVWGDPLDAAFIGAPDVPLVRCYHSDIPFVQGSKERSAMEIVAPTGEVSLSVSKNVVSVNTNLHIKGSIEGNGQTRGKTEFSGNGTQKQFRVQFISKQSVEPVVTLSSNQFGRSRIVSVDNAGFLVEFEEAPKAADKSVTIWWIAQL